MEGHLEREDMAPKSKGASNGAGMPLWAGWLRGAGCLKKGRKASVGRYGSEEQGASKGGRMNYLTMEPDYCLSFSRGSVCLKCVL